MVKSFTDYYGIDYELFDQTGALDPVLSVDNRFFIDPTLLKGAQTPELAESYYKVQHYFSGVLKIVLAIKEEGDRFWREADRKLSFPEVNGLSIGYSKNANTGSGIGPLIRKELLESVQAIVTQGIEDSEIFELVGLFEDGIGPDRISDMVAEIIIDDLIAYTQRICKNFGVEVKPLRVTKNGKQAELPLNPVTGGPVILIPREILTNLPVAESFADLDWIAQFSQGLRDKLNAMIGSAWSGVTQGEKKRILKDEFLSNPELLARIIEVYRNEEGVPYDFKTDPSGEVIWYREAKSAVKDNPLLLSFPDEPQKEDVEKAVLKICEQFKRLVEDNQLCTLLYDSDGNPKHESAAQKLFFGIAHSYCETNNIDLTAESDGGRGPVDFKASRGFVDKVLVEVKLSRNSRLLHGYEKQLPEYQKAERATRGIYLVIDNGGSPKRMKDLAIKAAEVGNEGPVVIMVDAKPRASASKYH